MNIQANHCEKEEYRISPIDTQIPLPPSQMSILTNDNDTADVFQLWHGKDALVPTFHKRTLPVPVLNDAKRRRAIARQITNIDIDVRFMSAREMANLSTELYMAGIISWEEYDALAFQAELHPDYNKTVGALTKKPAQPDTPRDFVREWEKRLSFICRYNKNDVFSIDTAQRITRLLRQLAGVLSYS